MFKKGAVTSILSKTNPKAKNGQKHSKTQSSRNIIYIFLSYTNFWFHMVWRLSRLAIDNMIAPGYKFGAQTMSTFPRPMWTKSLRLRSKLAVRRDKTMKCKASTWNPPKARAIGVEGICQYIYLTISNFSLGILGIPDYTNKDLRRDPRSERIWVMV